jgi:fermentation-respiration switch protein FrsA (DUF1100 family)
MRALRWLVPVGIGYATLVVMVWAMQGCMIHIPSRNLVATPADIGLGYEDLTLTTVDDEKLHAWFVPAVEARGTLLFFHGNAGNISHSLHSLEIFHELGLDVLIIDYRGYGQSTGRPSERGLYRDADAALLYLVEERGIPRERIVVFGRSLGGAVAANLASRERVGALILESVFTSVPDIGSELYPFLPVRLLVRYRYDTPKALETVNAPVLVIHSQDDEIIPYAHGRAIYEAAPEPRRFLDIQGDHNRGFMRSRDPYMAGLGDFLESVLE